MTIQELMEKRAKVWEAAKNFVDTHENENGVLSAEDSATYEKMEAEIEDLTKAIDRHQKAEQREQEQPDSRFFELVPVLRVAPRLCKLRCRNCG